MRTSYGNLVPPSVVLPSVSSTFERMDFPRTRRAMQSTGIARLMALSIASEFAPSADRRPNSHADGVSFPGTAHTTLLVPGIELSQGELLKVGAYLMRGRPSTNCRR